MKMETGQKRLFGKKEIWAWASLLLVIHFILSYTSARRTAVIADEPFHLARGAGLIFFQDQSFAVSHPPLINFINGLALLTLPEINLPNPELVSLSRKMDPSDRRNAFAHLLLSRLNSDPKKIIDRARIPTLILSLLLGVLVFIWAKKIYGPKAGLFALFLYSFCPNILAHSHLVTNDLGASLFILLSLYFYFQLFKNPGPANFILAVIFLGLAQLSKFTAILLYPLYLIIWTLGFARMKKNHLKLSWCQIRLPDFYLNLWSLLIIFLGSWLIIWLGYGLEIGVNWNFSSLLKNEICESGKLTAEIKCGIINLLAQIPLPPRTFFYGLARTLILTEQHEHELYFLGKTGLNGWWYYYPILFLIKTPIALFILLGLRIWQWKKINQQSFLIGIFLLLPIVWFFGWFILFNRKEIGIRHLLMAYPLIFIFISGLLKENLLVSLRAKLILGLVCVWFGLSSVLSFPDYLTYFNEAVGRRWGGLKISVLGEDWGQGVSQLAQLQKQKSLYPLFYLPYVMVVSPRAYGLEYEEMDCLSLKPGYYALHLNQLLRPMKEERIEQCAGLLKQFPPVYKAQGTIWVWLITDEEIIGTSPESMPPPPRP